MKKIMLIFSLFIFLICLAVFQKANADWIKGRDIYGRIKMTSGSKTAEIDTSAAKDETMIIALGDTVSFQDNGSDDVDAYEDSTNNPPEDMPLRLILPEEKKYTTTGPKTEEIKIYDDPDPAKRLDEGPLTVTAKILVLWAWYDYDPWWFNGESPANYHVTLTVTAQGATTGTFKWQVISGGEKVNLNNGGDDSDMITAIDDNTVTVKSTAPSASISDVTIRFTYNNVFIQDLNLTVRAPDHLDHVIDDDDPNGPSSFVSYIVYEIRDQFDQTLPYEVPWNEDIDGNGKVSNEAAVNAAAISDWTIANGRSENENWTWGELGETGIITDPNLACDQICRISQPPGWVPIPMNPYGGNDKIDHSPMGAWYVGSTIPGHGVNVKTLIWQIYQDHGRHE